MQKKKKTSVAVERLGGDQNEDEARKPFREGQTLQGPVSQRTIHIVAVMSSIGWV